MDKNDLHGLLGVKTTEVHSHHLSAAILSSILVLPWLLPIHAQPWTSFHTDAAMAIAILALAIWAITINSEPTRIPTIAIGILVLAAVPLAQLVFGLIRYSGDAFLATLYLVGFAIAIVIGARIQQVRPKELPAIVFSSLGVAATLSVGIALYQWAQLEWLGSFVLPLVPGLRATANLGQPNHLAMLFVWGLLAFWWAYIHGHASGALCSIAAALLLFGVAMTQSRSGALGILVLGSAAIVYRAPLQTSRDAGILVVLSVWFFGTFIGWASLNDAMQLTQVQPLEARMAPGTRVLHWRLLLDAMFAKPWTGWGWNQVVLAQVVFAPVHPASHEVIHYSHNLVLDLIIWSGIPVALIVCFGLMTWIWHQARRAVTPERALLLVGICIFLLYAQTELPHGYALFLLPAGLMMGALEDNLVDRGLLSLNRSLQFLLVLVLATLLGILIRDYLLIEKAWMENRMQIARIGSLVPTPIPDTLLLSNLEARIEFMRIKPRRDMSNEELRKLRMMAEREPSRGGLFRYAQAAALNHLVPEARRALVVLCRVHPETQCEAARAAWFATSEGGVQDIIPVWPVRQ